MNFKQKLQEALLLSESKSAMRLFHGTTMTGLSGILKNGITRGSAGRVFCFYPTRGL